MNKIQITQRGVFDADLKEIPVGAVIEHEGDKMPRYLVGKATFVGGTVAITNPATNPVQQPVGYAVVDKGKGWFVVAHDGQPVTKSLRADDLAGFDEMSDEDKAAFVDLHKAD